MIDSIRDPFNVHTGRLLLLAGAFTSADAERHLEGLSKIARLDFLLRYPVYLERVLTARGVALPFELWPSHSERLAVESTMARHRFGPFETRYYAVVGRLVGLGFCQPKVEHRFTAIRITVRGEQAAAALSGPLWEGVRRRAGLLSRHLDYTGNKIGDLIDEQLPPAQTRPWSVLTNR